MMKTFVQLSFLALFVCFSTNIMAQYPTLSGLADSTTTYKIELQDESVFVGNVLYEDSLVVFIRTSTLPKIEIPISLIVSIEKLNKTNFIKGNYWFKNPNATRYLFSPSAFNLPKGVGYYQNTYLSISSFNEGVTPYFSIGGGLELITTFTWLSNNNSDGEQLKPIFFVSPKVGFKVANKLHSGAGVILASNPNPNESCGFGVVYGIITYGSLDHNVTGAFGMGFMGSEFSSKPIFTLSGMTRLSRLTALVSENWFIPDNPYYNIYSYGIRFFGEKMAVDLAFLNNADIAKAIVIGIPYVDFVVKF